MKFFAPFQLSENISETPDGFLVCAGVAIGRVGEMEYGPGESPVEVGEDGKSHVTRSAEELFRPETIASFEGKPVTILHPKDHVNPSNWKELTVGTVQNVRRGEGGQANDLLADILIMDSRAIALVKNGLREVSCGYGADYVITGVGRGVQTNIIGNHLALVEAGRAGSDYAIKDHRKEPSMSMKDKIKAIFAKAQDEAMAAADVNTETPEKKEGFVTMKDVQSYFDSKFEEMKNGESKDKAKDAVGSKQDPQTGKPAEVEAKDADPVMELLQKICERLDKMEGAGTSDEEEEEETEDEDFEESTMSGEKTGDSASEGGEEEGLASRVEILAPGMKIAKGVKGRALVAAYQTADGKSVIDIFTGGKAPNIQDAKSVDMLFLGVSEVLKATRRPQLSVARSRVRDAFISSTETPKGAKTAEEMNEINAKHYGVAK